MSVSDSTATVPAAGVSVPRAAPRTRAPESRPVVTSDRLAWAALIGLVLAGAATVLCSASTSVLSPDTVRLALSATPALLRGPLSAVGPNLHLGGVIALFTLMCACYATLLRLGRRLPATVVVGAIVVMHLLMALAPPLLSTDVFSYGDYGRMSRIFHFNPYDYGPYALGRSDPWYYYIGAPWIKTPSVYGPLFTAISWLLGHLGIGLQTLIYKLIAVASSLTMIAITARIAGRLGRDGARAALFVGLNPVLVIFAVGGAHNDMLMMALLMASVGALVAHRARSFGGLLVAAIAVKLTAGLLLPFALASRRERHRPQLKRMLLGAVVVFVAVLIVSTILFGAGPLHLLGTLEIVQADGGRQSIPGFIGYGLGLSPLTHGIIDGLQAVLVISVVALFIAVRRHRMDWLTATGWAIVALLVTSTFLLPWYVIWLLPFAALSPSRRLSYASLALTFIGMTSL